MSNAVLCSIEKTGKQSHTREGHHNITTPQRKDSILRVWAICRIETLQYFLFYFLFFCFALHEGILIVLVELVLIDRKGMVLFLQSYASQSGSKVIPW